MLYRLSYFRIATTKIRRFFDFPNLRPRKIDCRPGKIAPEAGKSRRKAGETAPGTRNALQPQPPQRGEVARVVRAAPLGGVEVVEAVGEMLLDLRANDLHSAVDQSVLLGERLVDDGQARGQPPLGEGSGMGTSGAVARDLLLEDPRSCGRALLGRDPAGGEQAAQRLAVGHDERAGEGRLVVVDEDLVDVGRLVDDRLLHPLGAVLLTVGGDQQALEAPQNVEESVLRDVAHVARVQPSVAHGLGRRLGIFPVAGHDVLAADDDLALLAARQFAPLLVEDLQLQGLEDLARRAEAVPVAAGRVGRDDGRGLREAVALEHGDADGVVEALQLGVEQCAAAHEEAQRAAEGLPDFAEEHQVEERHRRPEHAAPAPAPRVAVAVVCVGSTERQAEEALRESPLRADRAFNALAEVFGQSRHREQEVGAHLADVLRDVLERLHRRGADLHRGHRGAAGDHDVEAHDVGEAVVERQDDERAVRRRDVDARERLLDVGRVVAVGEHHALGVGRRAGGVGDGGDVAVADRAAYGHEPVAAGVEVVAAQPLEGAEGRLARLQRQVAEDDDVLDGRQFGADAADLGELLLGDEQRLHLGVTQAEEQVVGLLELDRQRHADRPGVEEAQLRDDPGVATLGEDRHLVAGPDAERGEAGADLERLVAGLGVGGGLKFAVALFEQEGLGAVFFDGGLEQIDDGLLHGVSPF